MFGAIFIAKCQVIDNMVSKARIPALDLAQDQCLFVCLLKKIRALVFLFVFPLGLAITGCDAPPGIPESAFLPVSTVGERLNEAVQVNIKGSSCENERRQLLDKNQVDLVRNVDFLFSRFEPGKPDENLLKQRLKWVKDNDLEPLANKLANLLDTRKEPILEDLRTLFGDTIIVLPTKEQIWKLIAFLKKDEFKSLEKNLKISALKWTDPKNKEGQEIAAIIGRLAPIANSTQGRFVAETFLGESFKQVPNEDQVWTVLDLAFREEWRSLIPFARAAVNEYLQPTRDETRELLAIVQRFQTIAETDEAQFIFKLFFGENFLDEVKSEDVHKIVEFANRSEVQLLIPALRQGMLEVAHPTTPQTTQLFQIVNRFKTLVPDNFEASFSLPSEKQFLGLLPLLYQLELKPLAAGPEIDEILAILKRLHAFTKTPDGSVFLNLAKDVIKDEHVRKTMLDLMDVLDKNERYSSTYERFGIGLLFGDSWYSSTARYFCSVYLSARYSIDKDILNKLLDFGVVLYKAGIIDDFLRLEELAKDLALKSPNNSKLAMQIADQLEITLVKPQREAIETYLADKDHQEFLLITIEKAFAKDVFGDLLSLVEISQKVAGQHRAEVSALVSISDEGFGYIAKGENQDFAKKIYALLAHFAANRSSVLLSPQVGQDLLRLNELTLATEANHEKEISALKKIASDLGFSLSSIDERQINKALQFVRNDKHKKAFAALKQIASTKGLLDDLLRLDQLSQKLLAEHEGTFELLGKLAQEAGISFKLPPREKVGAFLAFVSHPTNQNAAKRLLESFLEFAMFFGQAQKQFASFPMPQDNASSSQSIFEPVDKITEEDFKAVFELSKLAFELWSLSPKNDCQARYRDSLGPQDLANAMTQLSLFLTTQDDGFKSWLALMRRVANDTKL